MDKIEVLENAVVLPPQKGQDISIAGAVSKTGEYVHRSIVWRGDIAQLRKPTKAVKIDEQLAGRHLYAGYLSNHFGHFQCESIARLWPLLEHEDSIDSIVYFPKRPQTGAKIQKFHKEYFDLLGIKKPIQVLTKPTRVESLVVADQGFGVEDMAKGSPAFRAYIHANFAKNVQPDGPEKLYVGRVGLGPKKGALLGEKVLVQYLEAEGYEIFHPEKFSLHDQIARYKAAKQIIALDGSALHLFGLVGREDQKVAIISRRSVRPLPDAFALQLNNFCGIDPVHIDGIERDWVVEGVDRPSSKSMAEPCFAAIHDQLLAAGFITDAKQWPELQERFIQRHLGIAAHALQCRFIPYQAVSA